MDEYLELHKDDPIVWPDRPHLISVDELRAAGALDVPPEWRKSLCTPPARPVQGSLFADDDDDGLVEY